MYDRDKSGRGEMEKDYMLSKSAQITYQKQDEKSFFSNWKGRKCYNNALVADPAHKTCRIPMI